jgi:hypothetical protein
MRNCASEFGAAHRPGMTVEPVLQKSFPMYVKAALGAEPQAPQGG